MDWVGAGTAGSEDPAHRLALALAAFTRLTLETEPQLRTMLQLSLEPGPGHELLLRRGRAIGWFEEALEPLRERLGDGELRRLVLAIRSACGIEALATSLGSPVQRRSS